MSRSSPYPACTRCGHAWRMHYQEKSKTDGPCSQLLPEEVRRTFVWKECRCEGYVAPKEQKRETG